MGRWRWPLALSAAVLLGQLLHRSPLVDVLTGEIPPDLRLTVPAGHVLLAPFTLVADWLNGGSRYDLAGFLAWGTLAAVVVVLRWTGARGHGGTGARRHGVTLLLCACAPVPAAAFVAWVAFAPRPMRRLETPGSHLVFDVHSHTSFSHDGRASFPPYVNADWHKAAGFDVAFVADHNRATVARTWPVFTPDHGPRALRGTELSLYGLHLLILGVADSIDNRGWNQSWDSTLALIRRLASRTAHAPRTTDHAPLLIAALPEFWRHHWGPEMGDLVAAGVDGFEVWTSSPQAMEFPPAARATLIARARAGGSILLGATDMHGLGWTASVWNVAPVSGWGMLSDSALTDLLIGVMREGRHRVIAVDRWLPATRLDHAVALPVSLALVLRQASRWHGLALLGWIWLPALVATRRRRKG